ncbi:MAG: hypothetical protein O7H39_04785 [Gammaproteobacteria bacterium]|nr:hypothetical protein [Gammaproteobacteria bacterium]
MRAATASACLLVLGACTLYDALPSTDDGVLVADARTVDGAAADGAAVEIPAEDIVAVVVSGDASAYQDIATALLAHPGQNFLRYSLTSAPPNVIREIIERQGHKNVVAIGPVAMKLMQRLGTQRIVYCQIFDDVDIRRRGYRGVSALPPFRLQLQRWKALEPELKSVGVIVSPQTRALVAELRTAAQQAGLELRHEEARSDKEALFVYQRLIPEIDGYIMLPDPSVLSPNVMRKMVSYGNKHGKSMLTFSRGAFELGASLQISAEPTDVANQIVHLLFARGATHSELTRVKISRHPSIASIPDTAK